MDRLVAATHDTTIHIGKAFQGLGQGFAGNGQHIAVQVTALQEGLEHDRHPTNDVQIACQITATGLQVGDQRRAVEHLSQIIHGEADTYFVCNGGDMQGHVGRATRRRHSRRGIFQALAGNEITRQRTTVFQNLHHAATGAASQCVPLAVNRWRGRGT